MSPFDLPTPPARAEVLAAMATAPTSAPPAEVPNGPVFSKPVQELLARLMESHDPREAFNAAGLLVRLDPGTRSLVKRRLKNILGEALNLRELDRAMTEARKASRTPKPSPQDPDASETVPPPDEPPGGEGPLTAALADAIVGRNPFAVDAGRKLYVFREGVYQAGGEDHIRRTVKALLLGWNLSDKWTSHRAREVCEYIRADAPRLWEQPPLDRINVRNGLVDVATHELHPHSPHFLSPVQLPIRFDPKATCPHWCRFVETTFPEDAQELPWELLAWLMTPDTSIQKAVLLSGEGSNGKSTFLTALIEFLGKANVANLSLQKLEGERFAAARVLGKLANVCPDLPSTHLTDTSTFKAITGGDYISAEYKHQDGFDFRPFCRLVFSANHPPRSADSSHAFFRRWLVVPFGRTFEEGAAETVSRAVLDRRLADPQELSGVLNRALAVLPRIREQGLTESPSMRAAWLDLRQTTDPLAVWLDRHTVERPEALVPKRELHQAYAKECEAASRPVPSSNAFGRALKRLKPTLAEAQRMVNAKLDWVWLGIGLSVPDTTSPTSLHSRHSRDSANCKALGERDTERKSDLPIDACTSNPVNSVNPVIASEPWFQPTD